MTRDRESAAHTPAIASKVPAEIAFSADQSTVHGGPNHARMLNARGRAMRLVPGTLGPAMGSPGSEGASPHRACGSTRSCRVTRLCLSNCCSGEQRTATWTWRAEDAAAATAVVVAAPGGVLAAGQPEL